MGVRNLLGLIRYFDQAVILVTRTTIAQRFITMSVMSNGLKFGFSSAVNLLGAEPDDQRVLLDAHPMLPLSMKTPPPNGLFSSTRLFRPGPCGCVRAGDGAMAVPVTHQELTILPGTFAVCPLDADAGIPAWAATGAFPAPRYRVEVAGTGAEGIERVCAGAPDVILLDCACRTSPTWKSTIRFADRWADSGDLRHPRQDGGYRH
jgi:hypothetical protein